MATQSIATIIIQGWGRHSCLPITNPPAIKFVVPSTRSPDRLK
jgi:hypothetical protein